MRDVLVDDAQSAGRVDKDVTQSILADDAAFEIAEIGRSLVFDDRRYKRRSLRRSRRLHDRAALKERREVCDARRVVALRCEQCCVDRRIAQELSSFFCAAEGALDRLLHEHMQVT